MEAALRSCPRRHTQMLRKVYLFAGEGPPIVQCFQWVMLPQLTEHTVFQHMAQNGMWKSLEPE